MTANERDPRVDGCHSEGGDSILSAFSWEPLPAKLQDHRLQLFLESFRDHDDMHQWKEATHIIN